MTITEFKDHHKIVNKINNILDLINPILGDKQRNSLKINIDESRPSVIKLWICSLTCHEITLIQNLIGKDHRVDISTTVII